MFNLLWCTRQEISYPPVHQQLCDANVKYPDFQNENSRKIFHVSHNLVYQQGQLNLQAAFAMLFPNECVRVDKETS